MSYDENLGTRGDRTTARELAAVLDFANQYAMTIGEARILIGEVGQDRRRLDEAARDYTGLMDR
jgi:hypothetical protein